MTSSTDRPLIGQSPKRVEDEHFLRGAGQYVDDIRLPGTLHAAFVRSQYAHALIRGIDTRAARASAGVLAVLTAEDIQDAKPIPVRAAVEGARTVAAPLLATERVRYVGEPIAVVIAEHRYLAEDAVRQVEVDYDPLAVAATAHAALAQSATPLHEELGDNVCYQVHKSSGDVAGAFQRAHRVVRVRTIHARLAPSAIETRGVLASFDHAGKLTLWLSSQAPFRVRDTLLYCLGLGPDQIRVLALDVGGGFGAKATVYREDVVLSAIARQIGRPVKWIATRMEDLANTHHARDHEDEAEAAIDKDGRILALRTRTTSGVGAYVHGYGLITPLKVGELGTGPYAIPAQESFTTGVYTNAMPCGAYRGAGLPEATFLIERIMDEAAASLAMDPVELRRRNLVGPERFPYVTPGGITFDSGDYPAILTQAVELAQVARLREEQAARRARGELVGIGVSVFTETTGNGWESAAVRVDTSGRLIGTTGSHSHGQGHATTFAQILADQFGVTLDQVTIEQGDSSLLEKGMGTFGSRSTVLGGGALVQASDALKDKLRERAAELLETQADDIELAGGELRVRGAPERAVTMGQVARSIVEGTGQEPSCAAVFEPSADAVASGAYVGMVSVDADTGRVRIEKLVLVDDCGIVINPRIVHGQVHGALAQGLGETLMEQVVHDQDGQLLTGSLLDYALPTATIAPEPELGHHVTPSPLNPLGVKGAGEAGTIGSPPTIVNAVLDALRPLGVRELQLPLTSERVWQAIQEATGRA